MIKIKKKDWIEIVLHIAFWVGVFYTLLSFTQPHIKMRINQNGTILEKDISRTISPYIFLSLGFMIVLFYSNIFWLFKKVLRYKNALIRIGLPIAWFCIIFMSYSYLNALQPKPKISDPILLMAPPPPVQKKEITIDTTVRRLIVSPVPDKLFKIKEDIDHKSNTTFISEDGFSRILLFIFIIVFGLSIAYFFLKEWARAERMHSDLAAVQLNTEIKFLKSQINPHFLFNTLNNLFSTAQRDENAELADGISKLSGMMRYMIYESNAESVPLKKEIEYLEDCIALNKLRYEDKEVLMRTHFPEQTDGLFVAPMIFIPFVENAFKHGVSIGQSSEIKIAISVINHQLLFTCENKNYSFIKKMADGNSGVGLENVRRRLELVYGTKYNLSIQNAEQYLVNLKIDLT